MKDAASTAKGPFDSFGPHALVLGMTPLTIMVVPPADVVLAPPASTSLVVQETSGVLVPDVALLGPPFLTVVLGRSQRPEWLPLAGPH